MGWKWKENQRGCYALDKINGLGMERNKRCCYELDIINGLKMERKSEKMLQAR